MNLREHQTECINNINSHFIDNSKGLIKMFCGAGKSFIIYHTLLQHGSNLSVVVVPSINLITQFNRDYLLDPQKQEYNKAKFNKKFILMTICSLNELDLQLSNKLTFTTDEDDISKFIKKKINKIILVTYQSLHTLFNVIRKCNITIDLLCFDEAHHILGDGIKALLFGNHPDDDENGSYENEDSENESYENEDSENESYENEDSENEDYENEEDSFIDTFVNKTLFFTATPKNSNGIKMYESHTEFSINDEYYEFIDDENTFYDEDPHCGPMIYEYMHLDGVNDNILNDFRIRVDLFTENTDKSVFEAISRSILETGNNRVLTFHSRSETISEKGSDVLSFTGDNKLNEFVKCFNRILKKEFPGLKGKYKTIDFRGITASTKNKSDILKEFDETKDNEIFILASCKTIGEGIDTKNANMVVFVDPKQSYIEIIQNIGRICRKNQNTKGLATVLIPAYVDVKKYIDCKTSEDRDKVIREEMSKTGNFNGILNVLSAMRQKDEYISELCLKYPDIYTNKEIKDTLRKNELNLDEKEYTSQELFQEHNIKYRNSKTEIENFERLSKKIDKNIQVINKKILEDDIFIDSQSVETIYFVKTENDNYMKVNGSSKKKEKIDRPNRNIKPFCHTNDEIKVLWDIDSDINISNKVFGGYIKSTVIVSNEEQWIEKLDKLKAYLDKHGKRPSSTDKNKEIRQLGGWMEHQITNYKRNQYNMKNNEKIKKTWIHFINESEYSEYFKINKKVWYTTLIQLKKYIDHNKKRPTIVDKCIKVRKISRWFYTQQKNYLKKEQIMKENEIYEEWSEFRNKYSVYFKKNIVVWYEMLNKVIKYIDEKNQRPSQHDTSFEITQLGRWINTQQNNYSRRSNIMKKKEIYDKWSEFKITYKELFKSNIELWYEMFEKTKKYIDENKMMPSCLDNNAKIKQLYNWIMVQQKNYIKKECIMKEKEIYDKWTEFKNEYKQYFKNNVEIWYKTLDRIIKYINDNQRRPSKVNKSIEIRQLGDWIGTQQQNYLGKKSIMKEKEIYDQWTKFIKEYQEYFPDNPAIKKPLPKSTTIKPTSDNKSNNKNKRQLSDYQKISQTMTIQKSDTTNKMFKDDPDLWHKYHDYRDFSFKGYDNQDEIPINKIISYLETKKNHKLKILDLGCGRNLIHKHFIENKKFTIKGYDHVSFNGSSVVNISNLPDEDESVKICIYSQSLMGTNWKDYIKEGLRVLEYNGEMIISESSERYSVIKEYLEELGMHIIKDDYNETKRWFVIHVIKN